MTRLSSVCLRKFIFLDMCVCYARKKSFTPNENKNQKPFLMRFFTSFPNQNQSQNHRRVPMWCNEDRQIHVSDNSIKISLLLGCNVPQWVKCPAGQLSFKWQWAADKRDRNSSSVFSNRRMILNQSCHFAHC